MSYVQGILQRDEQIVRQTRQHWVGLLLLLPQHAFIFSVCLVFLLVLSAIETGMLRVPGAALLHRVAAPTTWMLLAVIAVETVLVVVTWLRWWKRLFLITTRRVIRVSGILNKQVMSVDFEHITDERVRQSILGRILNYGDLLIYTANDPDDDAPSFSFEKIAAPIMFQREIAYQAEVSQRSLRKEDCPEEKPRSPRKRKKDRSVG